MHKLEIPASAKAIGRAGAGTNNIPVAALSKRGVPVFNAPGANANAVRELVLASLLLAARKDRKSTRLNSRHSCASSTPPSASNKIAPPQQKLQRPRLNS